MRVCNEPVEGSRKGVLFRAIGDMGTYENRLKRGGSSLLNLETKEISKATYSLSYLKPFVSRVKPLAEYLTLEFATDVPIKITVPIDPISLTWYLAPRIEED